MDINNIPEVFLWFIAYAFLGWAWETIITSVSQRRFVNRGFLNGPYCPIYGTGALLFLFFTNGIENPVLRFLAGAVLACALEYLTSWAMELIFHARWWDYTPRLFNLNGRICLEGFILFGLGAVATPHIHQYIARLTAQMPPALLNSVFSIVLIIFLADIVITNRALTKFNYMLREYQQAIDKHRLQLLEFIHRGKRAFEMRIGKHGRIRNVLSFQQRRILAAFPHFDSTLYEDALARIRKLNADSRHTANIDQDAKKEQRRSKAAHRKAQRKAHRKARGKARKKAKNAATRKKITK